MTAATLAWMPVQRFGSEGGQVMTRELLVRIRDGFALDRNGIHGVAHWARVRVNGLALERRTGANLRVVEAFAFLHDSQRQDDGFDPDHGPRAAAFVRTLPHRLLPLSREELDLLALACEGHSDGRMEADATVRTCRDADRLDLLRVGIVPDPARLCCAEARDPDFIRLACARSLRRRSGVTRG